MSAQEQKRRIIAELLGAGVHPKAVAEQLKVGIASVYRVKAAIKSNANLGRKSGSGRPRSARTPATVRAVQRKIRVDPNRSIRKLAREHGISRMAMHELVTVDLGLQSLTRPVRPLITEAQKEKRLQRARRLLNWIKGPGAGKTIVFSDEKVFTVDPVGNARNDRRLVHSAAEEPAASSSVTRTKHPASVMVLGAVCSDGRKSPLVFVPSGARLNAAAYQQLLATHIVPWLAQQYPGGDYVWQQDGAPAHTAATTRRFLTEAMAEFWTPEMWPPSSPDLNPLDFSVWAHVQSIACAKRHANVEALRAAVASAWAGMSADYIRKTCTSFRRRLEQVIGSGGEPLE